MSRANLIGQGQRHLTSWAAAVSIDEPLPNGSAPTDPAPPAIDRTFRRLVITLQAPSGFHSRRAYARVDPTTFQR